MFKNLLQVFLWRARKKKSIGFLTITLALILSILGNACTFYHFDGGRPFFECLWYSVISISTIGYGDMSAESVGARIGTVVFIVIIGLAAFTTFFGVVLDWFMDLQNRERKGMCKVFEKDHILIVNFPSAQRVTQVIEELTHDKRNKSRHVVIIANTITELPFAYPNVSFVQGSPIEEDTYKKANIEQAKEAIVLCTSMDDPNSDSVVASIVSIIEDIKPDLLTVAECLSEKHTRLFESSNCDSIVCSTRIVNNLLVHESQDKGVIKLVDVITTHKVGDTLFTMDVEETAGLKLSCIDLAKTLLDNGINVLCINRGEETFTDFSNINIQTQDVLVYVAKERFTWERVRKMFSS